MLRRKNVLSVGPCLRLKDNLRYQHLAWIYAFRFLRVSLSLELSTHQDNMSALGQLRNISTLSNQHGEKPIFAIAATMEAMISLQQTNSAEGYEQAQRALAAARSCQLDPSMSSIPQFDALMQIVDLCSALQNFEPNQATSGIQSMQTILETSSDNDSWPLDGSFAIPIRRPGLTVTGTTSGIIRNLPDRSVALMFNWMPHQDIYTLSYLLYGISLSLRNTVDGQKSELMLREGLRYLESQYIATKTDVRFCCGPRKQLT